MENYKPNSHKSKEAVVKSPAGRNELEKVVKGKVTVRKKRGSGKVTNAIISEDVGNVKSFVVSDVLIPAMKAAISDIITKGIDMLLYGESGRTGKRTNASGVSYRDYYKRNDDRRPSAVRSGSTRYSYDDIVLESRGEAEEVIRCMDEMMDQYQVVSVADLFDLVGVTCKYTDYKYGWTNIRNADVVRVREGYLIKMPRAIPID